MKLYTEEQVNRLKYWKNNAEEDYLTTPISVLKYISELEKLAPIELPSDEEIDEMGKDVIIYNDTKRGWFIQGLKFMRDKIQGGNK